MKRSRIVSPAAGQQASSTHTAEINAFRARHMDIANREVMTDTGLSRVTVNDGESPLAWLARRKGRDGQPLISPVQFLAGERLRADFTRAGLAQRTTSSWEAPISRGTGGRGGGGGDMTDAIIAARQRVQLALKACGPEFSDLLLDVCCFLRKLEQAEQARHWPARSAKVVLQLGLDRLARHYGLLTEIRGTARSASRAWIAGE